MSYEEVYTAARKAISQQMGWDPEIYGPGPVRALDTILAAALLSFPVLTAFVLFLSPRLALLAILAIILGLFAVPKLWRYAVGRGVDKELPALLSYLLVYSKSPMHMADLLLRAEGEGFRWSRYEISRLRLIMSLGRDPTTALKTLADTTPARKFGETIREYIYAQTMGASRTQLGMFLFKRSVETLGEQWRGHVEFGKIVAEGIVAAIVSVVAITPLSLLGGSVPVALLMLPLVVAPAGALVMLTTRPSIGELRLGYLEALVTFSVPFITVAINFKFSLAAGLAFLLGMSVVVEIMYMGYRRLSERALRELRMAADEARLGYLPAERLVRAEGMAPEVMKAIVSAAKVAGTSGLGDALTQLYNLMEEARRQASSASMQASVLGIIAALSIPIAIYSLSLLRDASSAMPGGGSPEMLEEISRVLVSMSPLVALPASVLQRGWLLSPVYPLLSQGVAMLVLDLI